MSLTKALLIDRVYNICGCSKNKATELTDSILETIKKSLESGEDVLITGFGKFCVREKNERRGRNPATGEDLPLENICASAEPMIKVRKIQIVIFPIFMIMLLS